MNRQRRALSLEYLDPGRTALGGGVSRQVLGIAITSTAILFGAKSLDVLGDDVTVVRWVTAVLASAGAVGGALYHPVRRFWWRGALAGVVATGSAFGMHRVYQQLRPDPFGLEFAVVALVGALPGIVVYYLLMRHQQVVDSELLT